MSTPVPTNEVSNGRVDCSCGAVITPASEGAEDVVSSVVERGCEHCNPTDTTETAPRAEESNDLAPDNSVGVIESAPLSEGGQ